MTRHSFVRRSGCVALSPDLMSQVGAQGDVRKYALSFPDLFSEVCSKRDIRRRWEDAALKLYPSGVEWNMQTHRGSHSCLDFPYLRFDTYTALELLLVQLTTDHNKAGDRVGIACRGTGCHPNQMILIIFVNESSP